ncbi:PDZ domain-containing protein [Neorhodopirellula pilleata]|nr:PDZ domain-containing protein [Neorhodopirellula pilleata]
MSHAVAWFLAVVFADNLAAQETTAPDSRPTDIEKLVAELSSDSYLRRRRVTAELMEIGPAAVEELTAVLDSGDLETTERVMAILQEIAIDQPVYIEKPPASQAGESDVDPDAAWNALRRIAASGGSQGVRAQLVEREVREVRRKEAAQVLLNHGVFIGVGEFIVGAREMPKVLVEIGDEFDGDSRLIDLLRWIDQIEYARIKGEAIRPDVLAGVIQMPDLKTLTLMQGELNPDAMKTLGGMNELRHLELRYIPMSGELVDQLATLPIRVSLTLNGTAAPIENVDALRRTMPGLEIELKQGGFLGVRCFDNFNECLINEVIPGKAAEQAGLLPGDIIVQADGKPIRQFKDLQEAINAHVPGDTLEIEYRRNDVTSQTTARLGKLEDK